MSGLPARYAKMGFRRGWAEFKRHHHLGTRKAGRKGSRRHHPMFLSGDFSAPALISRPLRKMSSITPNKVIQPIIDLGLIIAGMAIGATAKKIVPIKNPHIMNGGAAIVGVGGSLLTKNRFIKLPLIGIALQGTISEAKLLMPNMVPIAGDDEVVYLPMEQNVPQIEVHGDEDRVGSLVNGDYSGDEDRVGSLVNGDEEQMEGYDGDSGSESGI